MQVASNGKVSLVDALAYYPRWRSSLKPNRSPLEDERPWVVFSALDFLDKILRKDMVVFEFGSGGSSAYFASKTSKVYTVEHERDWFERTSLFMVKRQYNNWIGLLVEPTLKQDRELNDDANPDHYASSLKEFSNDSFFNYAHSIDKFDDAYFDVVMIDGRARVSCFQQAKSKVKKGGYIILDNSERESYKFIHEHLNEANWDKHNFFGPGPYVQHEFWQTTIWRLKS